VIASSREQLASTRGALRSTLGTVDRACGNVASGTEPALVDPVASALGMSTARLRGWYGDLDVAPCCVQQCRTIISASGQVISALR
jgi:hypothetical protein